MKTRRVILVFGAAIVGLVALHPPWIIHAVRYRMSFKGFPKVPPVAVVDTVTWRVPFAPVYAHRSLGLSTQELRAYEARLSRGDTAAVSEWREKIKRNEALYRVPDSLRSDWEKDSAGSVPKIAYQKKFVSASFEIDVARLSIHLLAVITATILLLSFHRSIGQSVNRSI